MSQSSKQLTTANYKYSYISNIENSNEQNFDIISYENTLFNSNNLNLVSLKLGNNNEQDKDSPNSSMNQSFKSEKIETEVFNSGFPNDSKKMLNDDDISYISYEELYITKTKMKTKYTKTKMKTNYTNLFVIKKEIKKEQNRRKFAPDSIKKKIKNHFFTFIIDFINIILLEFKKKKNIQTDLEFCRLPHNYKINVTNESLKLLQKQTIKDVIKTDISPIYSKKNKRSNIITCNEIEKEIKLKDIDNILNKKILYFFDKFYFPKRKEKYDLKEFDLIDLEIVLDKEEIGLFEDLLEKNKKNEENFEEYKEKMKNCCKDYFSLEKATKIFEIKQAE